MLRSGCYFPFCSLCNKWYEVDICFFQNAYVEHKEVKAAQGVKIAAKELEKAIAGEYGKLITKNCKHQILGIFDRITRIFCS